jgi:hypothetical protein
MRTELTHVVGLAVLAGIVLLPACSPPPESNTAPDCTNGRRDGDEMGTDCGGSCPMRCTADETAGDAEPPHGGETDVGCGGPNAPKCAEGKKCLVDSDCTGVCSYAKRCVDTPSCKPHLGGDTCGMGEVGEDGAKHESCCRSLPVPGYTDPAHPGATVYLDKYEITTGRVRAFIDAMTEKYGGMPNIRDWIASNPPEIWDAAWTKFLPADFDGETVRVDRRVLGDPRGDLDGPPIPDTDQDLKTGIHFQFNGQYFVYVHGNNCSTQAPSSYAFPTFFYPPDVLAKMGPEFPPRADGLTSEGKLIPAREHLEVKAMNCISNAMLQAFCHWDGGQLATDAVLDFVTDSPRTLGNRPGCGTQIGTEHPPETRASMTGGRCADLSLINATFDGGATLPAPNSPLNFNNYVYPFFADEVTHDKAWQISAPGRGSLAANGEQVDMVRINPGDEPWMDLAGNLNEAALTMDGATFTGKFGIKYRGIAYGSSRTLLNLNSAWPGEGGLRRLERAEARAGFTGGRCMRFK